MREINKIIIMNSGAECGNANKIRYEDIERGYRTIGCHYVICNGHVYRSDEYESNIKDGAIEEGRPVQMAGSHTRGHNIDSIAIMLIGKHSFTNMQMLALSELVNKLCEKYNIEKSNVFEKNHFDKNFHKLNITDLKKIIN
jgi:N-acetyl-anhydromuramyl-L-alanine amidase AmpD